MGGSIKDQLGRVVEPSECVAPAVILVTPQLGQNIGAAARAMLNFGLTDLRLVAPRDGWPNPAAEPTAAGALSVLDTVRVFKTTAEAVADLNFIMAATARRRELEIPVIGTGDAGAMLRSQGKSGILFGPEKAGLKNEDVVLCDHILTYPVNPAFHSLNLAQAVGVFGYIWASSESTEPPSVFDEAGTEVATREDLVRLFEHLEDELETAGFFFPPEKKFLMSQNIRAPLTRAKMSEQEVRTFRGIVKTLAKGRGRGQTLGQVQSGTGQKGK